jgi:hypothetical protein
MGGWCKWIGTYLPVVMEAPEKVFRLKRWYFCTYQWNFTSFWLVLQPKQMRLTTEPIHSNYFQTINIEIIYIWQVS